MAVWALWLGWRGGGRGEADSVLLNRYPFLHQKAHDEVTKKQLPLDLLKSPPTMPSLNIGVPSLSRALWTVVKCQSRTFHIASTARSSASSSASAALRSTLDRIQEIDGELNAVTVTFSVEELEKEAAAIDALSSEGKPLHGVPVLIKDALNVKGLQTTLGRSGSPKFDEPKATDAVVVTRLRDAGALVVGKTNMPRDGMDVQTFNSRFGVTGNVFALQRTSGGSSGGSAVAVASGMVPVRLSLSIYLPIYLSTYPSINLSLCRACPPLPVPIPL